MQNKIKKYRCPDTDCEIVELEEFTNIDFGNGYYCTLKKIGDSIVYSNNRGNMRYADVAKYYNILETFIERANLKKPIVEIRDHKNLTGSPNSLQKDIQKNYLINHRDDFAGTIVCNIPDLLKVFLRVLSNIVTTSGIKITVCENYVEAVQKAQELLLQPKSKGSKISFESIEFKPEWSFEESGFMFICGVIPQKLFYTSYQGEVNFECIDKAESCLNSLFEQGVLDNSSYIRIADYSLLPQVPLQFRNKYVEKIISLNKKHNCHPVKTYVCGANSFIKIAMQLYSTLMRQEFIFMDDVETVFKVINETKLSLSKLEKKKSIKVNRRDIEEIIALSGSLIWGETTKTDLAISANNPLQELASTLFLIQNDLIDLRLKEVEQTKKIIKSLDNSEQLTSDLKVKNQEAEQLNEELLSSNEQLQVQKEELEAAQSQLLEMNTNLEVRVKKRTTKLKRTVVKLNKTLAELDRFVYSASHDLSAPLKSVLGLLNIAKIDPDKNHISQCLNYIENSIYKLEDVIKSLISYSRNSRLELKKEPFLLGKFVNEIIGELSFIPTAKSIEFIVEVADSQQIVTDQQRLGIIFHNLINNSIKYTDLEKSQSRVVVSFEEDDKNYTIRISDNGIGIGKNQLKKIFKMFYRGTESSQGSGLGLFISKETAATIGGKIKVSAIIDEGSEFSIILPKE